VIDLLRELGSLSHAEFEELADWYAPPIYNARGLKVGEVVPDVDLEEAAGEEPRAVYTGLLP
jgi:hypothetical protein